jgi:hypothetical protein
MSEDRELRMSAAAGSSRASTSTPETVSGTEATRSNPAISAEVEDFLCSGLETELGGILVYRMAIECAQNEELRKEWEKYLEETEEHVELYTENITALGLDPEAETPGRKICRTSADGLLTMMNVARETGDDQAAEIVAAECVVIAETKCHLNWELVGELGKKLKGEAGKVLRAAYEQVNEQENEHLYHTQGWTRELWIARLGMPAVLPPPEEEKDVKTAIGAERAKNARKEML